MGALPPPLLCIVVMLESYVPWWRRRWPPLRATALLFPAVQLHPTSDALTLRWIAEELRRPLPPTDAWRLVVGAVEARPYSRLRWTMVCACAATMAACVCLCVCVCVRARAFVCGRPV